MSLLDTDVLVEAQRGRPAAGSWLFTVLDDISLPAAVVWEMLVGSRDSAEMRRARRFISDYSIVELNEDDSRLARDLIEAHTLSTGLSIPDFLIAAQEINRSSTLYTFNLKHFRVIPGLDAQAPYER